MAAEWTQFEANNERSMKNYYQRSAAKGDDKNMEQQLFLLCTPESLVSEIENPELIWSAF